MNKICPMCQKELINSPYTLYWKCPTEIKSLEFGDLISHYSEHESGDLILHAGMYKLESYYNRDYFSLHKFGSKNTGWWYYIGQIPAFEIKSSEQVINRIETIMVFS
jgi:hypothetical protein